MRQFTSAEREGIKAELSSDAETKELPEATTAYNLIQAVTGMAHQLTPARRLEVETEAGRLLRRLTKEAA